MDGRTSAVHLTPLDPVDFLKRSAHVYREKLAVVDGGQRRTYPELLERVYRFAHLLRDLGVRKGDRVAVIAPNGEMLLAAHFAVPLARAVLCALNVRLMPDEIAYILEHCGATVVVYDGECEPLLSACTSNPTLVRNGSGALDATDFESALARSASDPIASILDDEDATISLNYTSGTTGRPKGVMYTYRSVYLSTLADVFHANLRPESVYLWTLPMFHCNGWIFPWAVTAAGATHVCLRKVEPARVVELIEREGVTHLCGAPTVLIGIANHPGVKPFARPLHVMIGGAPPAPKTIEQMERLGATITHLYGLTETYGPFSVCAWKSPQWDELPLEERARLKARQGVPTLTNGPGVLRIVDDEMTDVPANAGVQGEIVMRGNNVMKGYYCDPDATGRAFCGGYFHSGDVAVVHPDGYAEIQDRSKDVIISGGENVSSVQVEKTIMEHPAVLEAAVVSKPDEKWGEVPKAFVTLKPGAQATESEIVAFCRERLPGFKTPKAVEFGELPKTSTGKIQKFVLREREWAGSEKRVH
jgi:fatty-acyl-CoA synthase